MEKCGYISDDAVDGFHMIGINWRSNFDAAKTECESRDATLASDLSDNQNNFIRDVLVTNAFCPTPG